MVPIKRHCEPIDQLTTLAQASSAGVAADPVRKARDRRKSSVMSLDSVAKFTATLESEEPISGISSWNKIRRPCLRLLNGIVFSHRLAVPQRNPSWLIFLRFRVESGQYSCLLHDMS